MTPRYGLQGRHVVITGAAGGIGAALARAFARQGARLLLVDREATALQAVGDSLAPGGEVWTAVCDLSSDEQVSRVSAELRERWGELHVLVNNAGSEYPTPIVDADTRNIARWSALLDNNVTSMVRLTQAVLPLMPAGASVINQSSIWGKTGVAGFSAYSASKHAIVGLTRSLALELGPRGIRVNAVCPGWIRTPAAMRSLAAMAVDQGCSEATVERDILARQAVPAMLAPDEIAGVFLFLASADAAPLTGQCLSASHGEVML